jgi:hypothetical protein
VFVNLTLEIRNKVISPKKLHEMHIFARHRRSENCIARQPGMATSTPTRCSTEGLTHDVMESMSAVSPAMAPSSPSATVNSISVLQQAMESWTMMPPAALHRCLTPVGRMVCTTTTVWTVLWQCPCSSKQPHPVNRPSLWSSTSWHPQGV